MTESRANTLMAEAKRLEEQWDWEGVVRVLSSETDIVEQDWELALNLGWAHYHLDEWSESIRWLRRANELNTNHPGCAGMLAAAYLRAKEYLAAVVQYEKALALADSSMARLGLAIAYLELGDEDKAENVHKEGIRRKPKSLRRHADYASFLEDIGREEEAAKLFGHIEAAHVKRMSENATVPQYKLSYGEFLLQRDRFTEAQTVFDEAEKDFQAAITRDPSNAGLVSGYAKLLSHLGRENELREMLDRVRALNTGELSG